MTFGDWLKEKIAEKPSTVLDFVRTTGISERTVYRWFSEPFVAVRRDHLTRVASALGLPRGDVQKEFLSRIAKPKHSRHAKSRARARRAASTEPLPGGNPAAEETPAAKAAA